MGHTPVRADLTSVRGSLAPALDLARDPRPDAPEGDDWLAEPASLRVDAIAPIALHHGRAAASPRDAVRVLNLIALSGARVLNDPLRQIVARDKHANWALLEAAGLPVPESWLGPADAAAARARLDLGAAQAVLVYKLRNHLAPEGLSAIRSRNPLTPVLAQRLLGVTETYRVAVLDGEPLWSAASRWNVHAAPADQPEPVVTLERSWYIPLENPVSLLATEASRQVADVLGLRFVAAEIALTTDGAWLVTDIDDAPAPSGAAADSLREVLVALITSGTRSEIAPGPTPPRARLTERPARRPTSPVVGLWWPDYEGFDVLASPALVENALLERGAGVRRLDPNSTVVTPEGVVDRDGPARFSAFAPGSAGWYEARLALELFLDTRGVALANDPAQSLRARDTAYVLAALARAGVPVPETVLLPAWDTNAPDLGVAKSVAASRGRRVARQPDVDYAELTERSAYYLAQRLLDARTTLRLVVVDGVAFADRWDIAPPGEWRTNEIWGAIERPADPDDPRVAPALALAPRVTAALGLRFAVVKAVVTPTGPVVLAVKPDGPFTSAPAAAALADLLLAGIPGVTPAA